MKKTKILMVCLGNICRSPLAEGILRNKLPEDRFTVDSSGTGDWHVGNPPDPRSIAVARKHGLDISTLKGRQFSSQDFTHFDVILTMDMQNKKDVLALAPDDAAKAKVSMILDAIYPDHHVDVPDPYYGGDDGFENVYHMLDSACDVIAQSYL